MGYTYVAALGHSPNAYKSIKVYTAVTMKDTWGCVTVYSTTSPPTFRLNIMLPPSVLQTRKQQARSCLFT